MIEILEIVKNQSTFLSLNSEAKNVFMQKRKFNSFYAVIIDYQHDVVVTPNSYNCYKFESMFITFPVFYVPAFVVTFCITNILEIKLDEEEIKGFIIWLVHLIRHTKPVY